MSARKRKPMGRPREISDEQIEKVLEDMGESGLSLKSACTAAGIAYPAVRQRIYSNERLSSLYSLSREEYLIHRVQELNRIVAEEPDVSRARLMCDNIKWEAARVMPKKYGDKIEVEHGGEIANMTDEQIDAKLAGYVAKLGLAGAP